jgi:hypothetical protein
MLMSQGRGSLPENMLYFRHLKYSKSLIIIFQKRALVLARTSLSGNWKFLHAPRNVTARGHTQLGVTSTSVRSPDVVSPVNVAQVPYYIFISVRISAI